MLKEITVPQFRNSAGNVQDIRFSYQVFGPALGEAPVVLVNHALSGDSRVTGTGGWWEAIVGKAKTIDTGKFSVLAFNMPGNGFDGDPDNLLHNYKEFRLRDIAKLYAEALEQLKVSSLFAAIGGSIGGALVWELAVLKPDLIEHVIPVATDYKATQWLRALCKVQEQILKNQETGLRDARMHAMTFYRSPQSLEAKFGAAATGNRRGTVEDWLDYHGEKLEERFQLASYRLMNHLLTTIDISGGTGDQLSAAATIKGAVHMIAVDSDRFFIAEDNREAYANLSLVKDNVCLHEIRSIHGHDAFLIENAQLEEFLDPVFNNIKANNEKDKHRSFRNW